MPPRDRLSIILHRQIAWTAPGQSATPRALSACIYFSLWHVAALAAILRLHEIERSQRLFAAGDPGEELYLVLRGRVEIR